MKKIVLFLGLIFGLAVTNLSAKEWTYEEYLEFRNYVESFEEIEVYDGWQLDDYKIPAERSSDDYETIRVAEHINLAMAIECVILDLREDFWFVISPFKTDVPPEIKLIWENMQYINPKAVLTYKPKFGTVWVLGSKYYCVTYSGK